MPLRGVRRVLALVFPILSLALLPGQASAATISSTPTFSGGGSQTTVIEAAAVCDLCAPDGLFSGGLGVYGLGAGVQVQAQASWSNPSTLTTHYSAGLLRQGQTLDTSDTLTPGAGTVTVNYSVSGFAGIYTTAMSGSDVSCSWVGSSPCNGWEQTSLGITVGPISDSDTIPCTMPLPGDSPVTCTKTQQVNLLNEGLGPLGGATLNLDLYESLTVTGSGVISLRIAAVSGGLPIPNNTLTFTGNSPSTVQDPISIGCTQPAGTDLTYSLTNLGYTAEPANFTGGLGFDGSAEVLGITVASFSTGDVLSTSPVDLGPIAMSAPDQVLDLGPVLANNVPPVANAGGPYSGNEGTPIGFDASGTTSPCGLGNVSFVWNFSDGGVAYGVTPKHTFQGPGTYTGQLTATDANGNSNTQDFSVTVNDVAPVANAGPHVSSDVGEKAELNGSGVAAGANQQSTLSYSWDFGDGTPSASGGASVDHVYKTPGTYTATLTVCNPSPSVLCDADTTTVLVLDPTPVANAGPNLSTEWGVAVTFNGSAVDSDSYEQPLLSYTWMFGDGSPSNSAARA